jgi:hypothetical protein
MGRGPLSYFARACCYGFYLQTAMCLGFVMRSKYGTDEFFERHWAWATPVTSAGAHSWWARLVPAYGSHKKKLHTLSPHEQECLTAWERVMAFDLADDSLWTAFSPTVQLHDSLIFFDSLGELRDGWWFLSLFYKRSSPVMTEIRREVQGTTVFLHATIQTEAVAWIIPTQYVFPSTVTLELDGANKICSVEHRWFGGPLVSRRTASVDNVIGDVGDLSRRLSGFLLSLALTNSKSIHNPASRQQTAKIP